MREKWAKRIVLFTALIVLGLAYVFARIQNPEQVRVSEHISSTELKQAAVLDSKQIETGKQIYQQRNCSLCHSIAGQGNPRNPLDGVGEKHAANQLRDFITGADTLQGVLPEGVRNMKQGFRELSDDELNALVSYMQSLRKN